MSKKKTEFVPGACIGYYDESFKECLGCACRQVCYNITKSADCGNIREIPKTSSNIVEETLRKYSESAQS